MAIRPEPNEALRRMREADGEVDGPGAGVRLPRPTPDPPAPPPLTIPPPWWSENYDPAADPAPEVDDEPRPVGLGRDEVRALADKIREDER